jgi:hypothetical protein
VLHSLPSAQFCMPMARGQVKALACSNGCSGAFRSAMPGAAVRLRLSLTIWISISPRVPCRLDGRPGLCDGGDVHSAPAAAGA